VFGTRRDGLGVWVGGTAVVHREPALVGPVGPQVGVHQRPDRHLEAGLVGHVAAQAGVPGEVDTTSVIGFIAGFVGSPSVDFLDAKLDTRDGTLRPVDGSGRITRPDTALHVAGTSRVTGGFGRRMFGWSTRATS
jgi:hypothetical protein